MSEPMHFILLLGYVQEYNVYSHTEGEVEQSIQNILFSSLPAEH